MEAVQGSSLSHASKMPPERQGSHVCEYMAQALMRIGRALQVVFGASESQNRLQRY